MVKVKGGKTSEKSVNISKGIIFGFFTIYLIVFGIVIIFFISSYQESRPGELRTFVGYLPLLCFLGAGFTGISFLIFIRNIRMQKTRETKSRKKVKTGSLYKQSLFLLIFIFSFVPLLAPIIDQGKNDHNFSVYNEDWDGSSDFKKLLEDEGYDCYNIQSSLSATKRLDRKVCLVLLGTNQFYNPFNEIPYFMEFFENGNSILICHDYGSTANLLYEIYLANMINADIKKTVPITIFPDGVLLDNESFDTSTEFPYIETFTDHPIGNGIDKVLLSRSTAAVGGPFIDFSGWDVIGYSSLYSFVDMNDDQMYDFDDDNIDISFVADAIGEDFPDDLLKVPLGGYPQVPFMAKDTGDARIFVSADASLFNNEILNEDGYDNQEFAINIIDWLTRGEDDWMIVFDEAHIRPEESRDISSPGIFGFIIQYIVQLSTNPLTAWIYPLLAVYTLRKYLPRKDKKEAKKKAEEEERKEEFARFRTSSFFAKKIEWYRDKSKYDKALTLLYRRLERKLNSQLGEKQITTNNVIEMVKEKEPRITRHKIKRITRFMDTILAIKSGKKIKDENLFEQLFFEMEWIVQNI
ncbi:MAG: hypothetical protein EU532_14235 [Promethearchaeota archaeon]|nr:MAG: hypothetical protein EU532_14235 [Candidatus Lokiarchaeota archaeon]